MFINKKENVILVGGSGTGKTHLAISLAVKALSKEYSVYFIVQEFESFYR